MNLSETIDFLKREQQLIDLKEVMNMPEGRRFIWRILGESGVFRPSFVAGSTDITAFNEGSRNFGLALLTEIMAELPESFLIMQREAVNYEQLNKKEVRDSEGQRDSDD